MKLLPPSAGRAVAGLLLICTANAMAAPVEVGFSTSGHAGHWKLTFWVKNNLESAPPDMQISVFGLRLPEDSDIEAPPGFGIDRYLGWYHAGAGGSATVYNRAWSALSASISPSHGMSGFVVHSKQVQAPTDVPWFVLARSASHAEYRGGDNFGSALEPGFEGLAVSVPEPASYGLFGLGLACIALARAKAAPKADTSVDPD